jgi:hypothetical protein
LLNKMFEKPGTSRLETEQGLERVEEFIESVVAKYQSEGVPVSRDGRVDMLAYKSVYPDVVEDFSRTREGKMNAEELRQGRLLSDGEKLEMLAYALFVKNLGERFIVARSSPHDDWANGVDTMLLDRETGNLVCAFDEVGNTTGEVHEKKLTTIQEKNKNGGASVKYALGINQQGDNKEVIKSSAKNVPVFYIALPRDRITKGINEFGSNPKGNSDFEDKLFTYFKATLSAQVEGLELYSNRLHPDLKTKLIAFKKVLSDLSLKQEKKK